MVKINGQIVGNECYPNNERILFSIDEYDTTHPIRIDFIYETDIDISVLIMYKRYLDDIYPENKKVLHMKYIPYSRMDRRIEGYIFSLKYFCQTINDLNFDKVIVLDPHSNVSTALLDRCCEYSISSHINYILRNEEIDYIFYPDAGAMKRYSEILNFPVNYFFGNKKRDLTNGDILKYELVNAPDLKGKTVLIIDDLCSKGGTFMASSSEIKANGASEVLLYVTHCELSIYKGSLLTSDLVNKIYTTDSLLQDFSSKKIIKLEWM